MFAVVRPSFACVNIYKLAVREIRRDMSSGYVGTQLLDHLYYIR